MLLLTTTGRKTGLPRRAVVSYTLLENKLYVLPGWGKRCDWYQNLLVNPIVTVQANRGAFSAAARQVSELGEFRQVFQHMLHTSRDPYLVPWLKALGIQPDPDDMLNHRQQLLLVALERSEQSGPPDQKADLVWLWPVLGLIFASGWLVGRRSRPLALKMIGMPHAHFELKCPSNLETGWG